MGGVCLGKEFSRDPYLAAVTIKVHTAQQSSGKQAPEFQVDAGLAQGSVFQDTLLVSADGSEGPLRELSMF